MHIHHTSTIDLLELWLAKKITPAALTWLKDKRSQISQGGLPKVFFTAFSAVLRYTGKQNLDLTPEDWELAQKARLGWSPMHWSVDQAARTLLVLALPSATFLQILEQAFTCADIGELVALYQALPLIPHPEQLCDRAAEGVRSNITAVYNAIALRNPFPAEYFSDLTWNQMILKALFLGSPLHLIFGLEKRRNLELAKMLVDYAHERWAAKRPVSFELWWLVGKFATPAMLTDLEQVLANSDPMQQAAGALACVECPLPEAQRLLER